jgi:hypothetical protein
MERDDLRAALGDLAQNVEDADRDALSAVRDRGRRRRRRRTGAITAATSALLVAIVLIGVVIAGHHQAPDVVATGPPATSTPTTTSIVCTEADLAAFGTLPMPAPTIVTKTRSYKENVARLDPPPPGVAPKVPASVAWAGMRGTYRVAKYDIALGSYSALIPSDAGVPTFWHRLMWVVTGTHVPITPVGGPAPLPGVTTVPHPVCYFATQITLIDANTGQQLETSYSTR